MVLERIVTPSGCLLRYLDLEYGNHTAVRIKEGKKELFFSSFLTDHVMEPDVAPLEVPKHLLRKTG